MAGLLEYTKNGQVTEPPLYRFMRGNVQSFLNSIPDPSKMTPEQQLSLGANVNPIMGLLGTTAYHGSPAIFDKFNINKVGSGEGAQAYGHGMYFAENPEVAKFYQSAGQTVKYTPTLDKFTNSANYYIDDAGNYMKVRDWITNDTPVKVPKEEYLKKFEEINKIYTSQPKGALYKVDIPDTAIPKMLEWDKPLSSQNKEIQPAINQALDKIKKLGGEVDKTKMTGKDLYFNYQQYRGNNPDFASEGLKDMGIYGIKYLDATSRGTNKGTSNFVVFDPSEVKILEKGLLK
jgi:hypothetical protein